MPQSLHRLPEPLARSLSASHLPALDALRAFAAFLVVFYHYGFEQIPGGLGVLAFFVLSGFLITWLLLKEHDKHGTVSLRLFYLRRSLRIFPAFYFYWILVVAGLWFFGKRIVWPQAIASFLYLNNYYQAVQGDPNTALSHTWSLGIEEQFYLLWPAAFLWLVKRPGRALSAVAGAIGAVWVWRFWLRYIGVGQGYFYEAFDTRMDSLLVGCGLAIALRTGLGAAWWRWLCDRAWKPAGTLGLLTVSVLLENRFGVNYRDLAGFLVNPLLVAVLIVQWIALSPESRAWRWLNQRWLVYLGAISYPIYLYQQIVPGFVEKALRGAPDILRLSAVLAGVTLAASFSYFIVERPFLKLKDRIGSR